MLRLSINNIRAAADIRALPELASWNDADRALAALQERFPDNTDRSAVLAKASAIDKLYATRAGNIYCVADAVVATMVKIRERGLKVRSGIDIVDEISNQKTSKHRNGSRCPSFASKYCHFFVEAWAFPIYDSFAVDAVNRLSARLPRGRLTEGRSEYREFCEKLDYIRTRDGLEHVDVREMDRFLWLWGQWFKQTGKAERVVNEDVHKVFRSEDATVLALLRALGPSLAE